MMDERLMERKLVVILLRGLLLLVLTGVLLAVLWIWQGPAIRSWLSGKGPGEPEPSRRLFLTGNTEAICTRSGSRNGGGGSRPG
jgi:hypothetical protein